MKKKLLFLVFWFYSIIYAQTIPQNQTIGYNQMEMEKIYKNIISDSIALNTTLTQSIKQDNPPLTCFVLNKLGAMYRDVSLYKKSLQCHFKALDIATQHKITEQIIISKNMIGVVYRRKDEIIPAINYHQAALKIAETVKNPNQTILRNIAISYNSLGNIYLTMNQLDAAYKTFNHSLSIEKKIGNILGLAINHQNIGGIFEQKNQLSIALQNYQKSLQYNTQINSDLGKLICNNSIGRIYLKKKELDKAKTYLLPTIAEAQKFQDDFYTANSYINTGWLYKEQNNKDAENFIIKGLQIAQKQNYLSQIIEASQLLSEIYESRGNVKKSLYYYKLFAESKEKLLNNANYRYTSSLNTKYLLEKKKNQYNVLQREHEKALFKLNKNTLWFGIVLLIILLIGTFLYFQSNQRMLKKDKEILLMEQNMLGLQMNPHFIFNALNSIKSLIIREEKEKSIFYLNKFAKFSRTILSSVHQKNVSLKEEIDTIQNYVDLENMRFSNSINFEVQIDPDVDINLVQLPSLLLQVFVENAIWHGLSTKKGDKKISINIKRSKDKYVLIQVQDNGIGRQQANNLNIGQSVKKKSLGIEITNQRLQNYFAKKYALEIIDLIDQDKPLGTLVNLVIPQNR